MPSRPLLPRALVARGASEAVGDVVGAARRPALPLALTLLLVLFLLAQHRIDRRDPKLAAVPVEPEPTLGFAGFVRRSGSAPT